MPTISLNVKVFLLLLASAAGVLASVLGNVLAPNILYRISKRGRPPTARSPKVWAAFAGSAGIFVIVGTLAAVAPLSPAHDGASGVEDLEIVHIAVSTRRPLWDIEWLARGRPN
jgi:predicted lysophospholipase L1 biosynthesis ABC-type transport system permease subunit